MISKEQLYHLKLQQI